MTTDKIHFTQEKETMLMTLYARAVQSRGKNPILPDRWAEDAIRRIDYDFSTLKVNENDIAVMTIAIRAKNLDLWAAQYLADHPDATVLHLGCGMDSRVFRIDPPAGVRWFDVDYPEVIDLRRQLYPERPGYRQIGSSVANLRWLDEVPGDRPALIIAEGLMMYLTQDIVKALLNALTGHFPGGQMIFDAVNRQGAKMDRTNANLRAAGTTFGWWIDDPRDIKLLDPKLELVTELRSRDAYGYDGLPGLLHVLLPVMDLFPSLRRLNRLLRYQF